MYGGETNRMGWGVASCGVNPSPIRIRVSTELPSPSASAFTRVFDALRGEGASVASAPVAASRLRVCLFPAYRPLGFQPPRMPARPEVERGPGR